MPSIIPVLTEKLPVVSGGAAKAAAEKKLVAATAASQLVMGDDLIACPAEAISGKL